MEIPSLCLTTPAPSSERRTEPSGAALPGTTGKLGEFDAAREFSKAGQLGCLDNGPKMPTTMELFRDVLVKQVDREQWTRKHLEELTHKTSGSGPEKSDMDSVDRLQQSMGQAEQMLELHIAFQNKALGGSIITTAAKAAGDFCKTLMRSQ